MPRIRLAGSDVAFDCDPGDTILRAALRAGLGMSYSCNVGACGNCRFELLDGAVAHQRAAPPAWTERDRAKGRWLGCQAAPATDCTVKFRQDPGAVLPLRPLRRDAVLISATPLNYDITEFSFHVSGDPAFLPGQYAILTLPGANGPRVYSMSNLPEDGHWSFQIRRVEGGAATGVLFDRLAPGDGIDIDGPYGLAYLREDTPCDLALIAGGSGLSPISSIARAALARTDRSIRVFFGGRGPDDTTAARFLADLDPARLTLTCAISDPTRAAGWSGPVGFIHDVTADRLGDRLARHDIYFAGPPLMAQAVQKTLHDRGVPSAQIHFDEFY